jgi:hypothetical protein
MPGWHFSEQNQQEADNAIPIRHIVWISPGWSALSRCNPGAESRKIFILFVL